MQVSPYERLYHQDFDKIEALFTTAIHKIRCASEVSAISNASVIYPMCSRLVRPLLKLNSPLFTLSEPEKLPTLLSLLKLHARIEASILRPGPKLIRKHSFVAFSKSISFEISNLLLECALQILREKNCLSKIVQHLRELSSDLCIQDDTRVSEEVSKRLIYLQNSLSENLFNALAGLDFPLTNNSETMQEIDNIASMFATDEDGIVFWERLISGYKDRFYWNLKVRTFRFALASGIVVISAYIGYRVISGAIQNKDRVAFSDK